MATVEVGTIRKSSNYGNFEFVECSNAGKRGKFCFRVSVQVWAMEHQLACDVEHNLEIKFKDVETWAQVQEFAELAAKHNPEKIRVFREELKSYYVVPFGVEKIRIENKNFVASIDYGGFSASDLTDRNNEPRAYSVSSNVQVQMKTYEYVRKNRDSFTSPNVCMYDFCKMLEQATGIQYRTYYAMN